MSSPQLENGYFKIATELAEAFYKYPFTGLDSRVVWFVMRKTYGFHKPKDRISLSQFERALNIPHASAVRSLKSLVSRRILGKDNGIYWLNKNYNEWLVSKRILVSGPNQSSIGAESQVVSGPIQTIDNTKDNKTINNKKESEIDYFESLEKLKTHRLYDIITKRFPNRDYPLEFELMVDWYLTNKKRRPKKITAWSKWLSNAKETNGTTQSQSINYTPMQIIEQVESAIKRGLRIAPDIMEDYKKAKESLSKVGN